MLLCKSARRFITVIDPSFYIRMRLYCVSHRLKSIKHRIKHGPGLKQFIAGTSALVNVDPPYIPYLLNNAVTSKRKVFFDLYGCQMNLNDTEIVWSILKNEGFEKTENEQEADIFLVMTCAIREGAETKIWHRLDHLRGFKMQRAVSKNGHPVKIGILGCMAERLKEKLIEKEKSVDIVAGPDSYRDLPRLLAITESGQTAVNVLLSLDETYADVVPVRLNKNNVTAFISIMRGCDNMCTYCIVPFTRGKERSRPVTSIVDEIRQLSDQGVKEVTLLGQNVNSYRDISQQGEKHVTNLAKGFKTVYKSKKGGLRFADLLEKVSSIDPEMRIRFTAAHPKDFPDEVLQIIAERNNICNQLHLPAQSGSSTVLERMRRGYTREAYLELVTKVKSVIPGVGLSTDMICGFCGETEEEFQDTLTLMETVRYHTAFLFPYSMREKTTAHRRYEDDVPIDVKKDRHTRMLKLYTQICQDLNQAELGKVHLVLIEGINKKTHQLVGRNELYLKVNLDQADIVSEDGGKRIMKPGDYVAVKVTNAKASSFSGIPLYHTSIKGFYRDKSYGDEAIIQL